MLRNPTWHATDTLTLAQLNMVHTLADQIGLTGEELCRALKLTEPQWQAWIVFLAGGPLPAAPPLPEMLLRLGEAAFNLSLLADGRDIAA